MRSQTATFVCEQPDFDLTCLACEHEFWKWEMPAERAECPACKANPYEPKPQDDDHDWSI